MVSDIVKVIYRLLEVPQNSANENSSIYAGNLVMITFNNLYNGNMDPNILNKVVHKLFRSRMPSTVQGLVLVYARMINNNPQEAVNYLTSFSIDNRMALKVLIDKWLLQQPVFRGKHTKNATYLALTKLFKLKDKRLENLLVLAYNPSHANTNNDVYAPFKIFSTLIRGLDNEMAPLRKDKDLIKEAYNYGNHKDYDDGRLDTMEDDDLNMEFKDEEDGNQIEVDLDIAYDDEGEADIEKRFGMHDKKGGGLGDFETGSTNYMTEGLAFGFDDGDECDETTEEDLVYLKDQSIQYNTVEMLKQFFNDQAKDHPDYFAICMKNLLKEDVALLQKYIKVKNFDDKQ